MKKTAILILILSALMFACSSGEQKAEVDACSCAKEIREKSNAAPNYAACIEARKDSLFERDFVKCSAALVMNKDTNEIKMGYEKPTLAAPADGAYQAEPSADNVKWRGQNVVGKSHLGTLAIKRGSIVIEGGKIKGGELVLDMNTLTDTDMAGKESQPKLEKHLKSADFFDVAKFPEASYTITTVSYDGDKVNLNGNLTIKGITQPTAATVMIVGTGDNTLVCNGGFTFDRSKHDVRYGSGSFFKDLGDDMIEDIVNISFSIYGKK